MNSLAEDVALDRLLEPVSDCLDLEVAKRIVALRADEATQKLLNDYAEKNSEGTITPDELAVYNTLVQGAQFIALLQAKARKVVTRGSDC